MTKGIRRLGGKAFVLVGKYDSLAVAKEEQALLYAYWDIVKIRKLGRIVGCFSCWAHGPTERA